MNSLSQKIRSDESRECDTEKKDVVKTTRLARELLNHAGITSESWADELKVTARTVQRWRCGETEIPESRHEEVIWKAKELITKQREAIEREIDLWMRLTYGPNSTR